MSRMIVSLAVGERYTPYLERLQDSYARYAQKMPLYFRRDNWPSGSPTHQELHYAFKYHMVAEGAAMNGTSILWLDASCYLTGPIEPVFDALESEGVFLVVGQDILGHWISDKALAYFKTTRDEAMKLRLCAGAIVGVDLTKEKGRTFMEAWKELAATDLFFSSHSEAAPDAMRSLVSDGPSREKISDDPRCLGHRSDEACFSLLARDLNIKCHELGALFAGGVLPAETPTLIRCGY